MATIKELAEQLSAAFTAGPRKSEDTGKQIRILREGSPHWMTEVCHAAHGDMLPDDWRYQFIEEAADAIAAEYNQDGEGADDTLEADIYTADLTRWLGSRADRYGYCDEALEEYGETKSTIDLLQRGQLQEKREVFGQLLDALREQAEQAESEELR